MQLHYEFFGEGDNTVVLLHGMASSGRYWRHVLQSPVPNTRFIAIDLLGFGKSPMPKDGNYTYNEQVQAIEETLLAAGVNTSYVLVAHSMGSLIALRLAARSKNIKKLILCGLPYYPDIATARKDITQSKKIWELAYYGPTSNALCTLWCSWLRPFSKHIAPLYLKRLPKEVAEDSLLHTWRSYSQSLENIIEKQNINNDLNKITIPVLFLYGAEDTCGRYLEDSKLLDAYSNVVIRITPKLTHQLPLEKPELIITEL